MQSRRYALVLAVLRGDLNVRGFRYPSSGSGTEAPVGTEGQRSPDGVKSCVWISDLTTVGAPTPESCGVTASKSVKETRESRENTQPRRRQNERERGRKNRIKHKQQDSGFKPTTAKITLNASGLK